MQRHWIIYEWVCVALAIVGAVLNARLNIVGFYFWIASDLGLIYYNCRVTRSYGQALLYLVFLLTCIYGLVHWG